MIDRHIKGTLGWAEYIWADKIGRVGANKKQGVYYFNILLTYILFYDLDSFFIPFYNLQTLAYLGAHNPKWAGR